MAAAYANYNAAVEALKLLKSRPLPVELQAAQSAYDAAKADYDRAWNAVDEMKRMPKAEDLQQAQAAVDVAQAALAGAEAQLQRLKDGASEEELKVVDSTVEQARQQYNLALRPYTKEQLEIAAAQAVQAEAALEMVEVGLAETVVASPVDGVVAERFLSQGALVGPTTPIVSLISNDLELVLGVEESQVGQVKEGQKAEITVAAYPEQLFPAKVSLVAPSVGPRSRTFQVRVKPADPEGKLRAGMFARVKIVTREKDHAVLVPKEAVVARSGQSSVFVLADEGVQPRPVRLGLADDETVEVLGGLKAGEEVVVAGQSELRDGDRVRVN